MFLQRAYSMFRFFILDFLKRHRASVFSLVQFKNLIIDYYSIRNKAKALIPKIFLISFIGLLTPGYSVAASDCKQHQCVAIVDAGSTGSRLHIYAYDVDITNTPINITEVEYKKIQPGFSTLDPNQLIINSYLTRLFSTQEEYHLPIYFYATAGMRLLPQVRQQRLYDALKNWFSNQSAWKLQSAKTITGHEEGLFGWLAVNYQLSKLSSNPISSLAVMDMGGASVQITFPIEHLTNTIKREDLQTITLYNHSFTLFTHSFLGLGQTEVSQQFLDASACFSNGYILPNESTAHGNVNSCRKKITLLLNGIHHVNKQIQPALQNNPVDQWFVLGGMAELAQSQPFQFENHQFKNEELLEQANTKLCQQPWSELNTRYPNDEYLYEYCLAPAYYYSLMVDGYGVLAQQPVNFMTTDQVRDWTLGVVFRQTLQEYPVDQ